MADDKHLEANLEELYKQLNALDNQKRLFVEAIISAFGEVRELAKWYGDHEDPSSAVQELTDRSAHIEADLNREIMQPLEAQREQLQRAISRHHQHRSKPLRIVDLPDEILLKIFGYLRMGEKYRFQYYYARPYTPNREKPISGTQSARLSCKRLCGPSSHFLLRTLIVDLTPASVHRLQSIAKNPVIAQGVTTVILHLGVYSPKAAESEIEFLREPRQRLAQFLTDNCEDECPKDLGAVEYGMEILNALNMIADPSQDEVDIGKMYDWRVMVSNAYWEYRRRGESQQAFLGDNRVVSLLAESFAGLPRVSKFWITDTRTYFIVPVALPVSWTQVLRRQATLDQILTQPMDWSQAENHDLGFPLSDMLIDATIAFTQRFTSLKTISICLTALGSPMRILTDEENRSLELSTQHLERFWIKGITTWTGWTTWTDHPDKNEADQKALYRFVKACTHGKSLQSISLSFHGLLECERPRLDVNVSASSLIHNDTWGQIDGRVWIEGVRFTRSEIMEFIDSLNTANILSLVRIGLVGGTWYEVLEVLRARGLVNVSVQEPWGGEMDHLGLQIMDFSGDANPCNRYIVGDRQDNPFEGWH
ncbi:hypothetical protein F4778DRAFT_721282 [Xylariomycetidae sp. FL2044]|nr:hypothetical protein F4778DRAFT_721282 [Xylariomycetidae sp. FL2044]